MTDLKDIPGIGPAMAGKLHAAGHSSALSVAQSDAEKLTQIPGISQARARAFVDAARKLLAMVEAELASASGDDAGTTAVAEARDEAGKITQKKAKGKAKDDKKPSKPKKADKPKKAKAAKVKADKKAKKAKKKDARKAAKKAVKKADKTAKKLKKSKKKSKG